MFAWIGAVLVALLLVTPTLGTYGPGTRFYGGERFVCWPALGPMTNYPVNLFQEPGIGSHEDVFQVAVCAEQRSRRIGWALALTVPTMLIGLSAWRQRVEETGTPTDGPVSQ